MGSGSAPSTGGVSTSGGASSSGGAPSTGGVSTSGGAPSTGGVGTSGGAPSTGGVSTSGGAPSTGGVGTTGGAANTGGDSGIPATFATFKTIASAGCDNGDCHDGNEANPLNLVDRPELYEHITTLVSPECENLPIVDPGNPEGSALIKLLKGPCGTLPRMPKDCFVTEFENTCVSDDYIAAIEAWVAAGAPEQ